TCDNTPQHSAWRLTNGGFSGRIALFAVRANMKQSSLTAPTCGTVFITRAFPLPPPQTPKPNLARFRNPSGLLPTFNQNGDIDLKNAFFQNLGTNARNCGTCHQLSDAMSISAAHVQKRFDDTDGRDPIFASNDGSNCDHDIDLTTVEGRADAFSLL